MDTLAGAENTDSPSKQDSLGVKCKKVKQGRQIHNKKIRISEQKQPFAVDFFLAWRMQLELIPLHYLRCVEAKFFRLLLCLRRTLPTEPQADPGEGGVGPTETGGHRRN
jgi:hypothetical protein